MMTMRWVYFLSFAAVVGILGFSIYLQLYAGIIPCPLCTLQRGCFALVGIFSLIGFIGFRHRTFEFIMRGLCILFSTVGLSLAIRQVWLQHFPHPHANECGVSLQYMLQVLPLKEVASKILAGTAECSTQNWQLLSLTMPEWAVLCFLGFLFLYVSVLRYRK